jgi:hypothetical protein
VPARRSACLVVALVVLGAGAACSDDGGPEPERAEERPTTTAAPGGTSGTGPGSGGGSPALGDTEAVEGEDRETIEELAAFVEDVRGRSFLATPAVRLADDDTYEEVLGDLLGATLEELVTEAAYLEALGLIPEGSAVQYAEAQRQQLLATRGFYDEGSGILLVRGADVEDATTRAVVVHELVHVYDDQHFSLDRTGYGLDATSERSETFPMVVEGDAVRVEEAYVDSLPADERAEVEEVNGVYPGLDDLQDVLTFDGLVPYVVGRDFIRHLSATGGEALVDDAVGHPPLTTEQVLHPEVFDRGEGRRPVPPPPAEAPVVDQGVEGELFWTTVLRFTPSELGGEQAAAAALGWGGDAFVSWLAEEGLVCTRSDVEGDTPADTAELLAALQVWVEATPDGTVESTDEGRVRVQVCYDVPIAPTGNPSR